MISRGHGESPGNGSIAIVSFPGSWNSIRIFEFPRAKISGRARKRALVLVSETVRRGRRDALLRILERFRNLCGAIRN